MNPLTLDIMLLLFLLAALSTLWRWHLRRSPVQIARMAIFVGGVVFYVWLKSPWYDQDISRWWVRALLVAWLLPEVLENLEAIRGAYRDRG